METIEYRCVLIRPRSHEVLALAHRGRYHLPRVHIRRGARPAQEVQRAIRAQWGLNFFVVETWIEADGFEGCAIAELITPEMNLHFNEVPIERLLGSEVFREEQRRIQMLFEDRTESPLARFGWLNEAIAWMASATGRTFRSFRNIEQWNAGGGFALLRVCSDDGRHYWLKATGEPNIHEFAITSFLGQLCPDCLPKLVAIRNEWNAWLTEDAGEPLPDAPSECELVMAASSMARLQVQTIGRTDELLAAGAFDQRLPALRSHIDAVVAYLIDAMARQSSAKANPLSRDRLLELGEMLRDLCFRVEELGIPDALIHNDLNPGNILSRGANLVFTDWSEAAVGNPFLSCERLCQLNRTHAGSVRGAYRDFWSHRLSAETMDEAIVLTPLLTIYAYLYGRGDWLAKTEHIRPQLKSYTRSLARHMDRVARDSSLLEVLCH